MLYPNGYILYGGQWANLTTGKKSNMKKYVQMNEYEGKIPFIYLLCCF